MGMEISQVKQQKQQEQYSYRRRGRFDCG